MSRSPNDFNEENKVFCSERCRRRYFYLTQEIPRIERQKLSEKEVDKRVIELQRDNPEY